MKTNLNNVEEELTLIESMTDEEVCEKYNVDDRIEAVEACRDWWIMMTDEPAVDPDELFEYTREQFEMIYQ